MQNAQGHRVNDERHLSEESCLCTSIDFRALAIDNQLSDANHCSSHKFHSDYTFHIFMDIYMYLYIHIYLSQKSPMESVDDNSCY